MSSRWVFNNDNGSASNCASNCTNNCGNNFQNNDSLRRGLFGSVAPLQGITLNAKTKFGQPVGQSGRTLFRYQETVSVMMPCHIKGGAVYPVREEILWIKHNTQGVSGLVGLVSERPGYPI